MLEFEKSNSFLILKTDYFDLLPQLVRSWRLFCVSSFIFCYRGPGGGRPWPNPTNANSVSKYLKYIRHHLIFREVFLINTTAKKFHFIQQIKYCVLYVFPCNPHTEQIQQGAHLNGVLIDM